MIAQERLSKSLAALALASCLFAPDFVAAQSEPPAQLIETSAKTAMILDGETGAILFEKDPDAAFPPASLAKLMTMEIVFAALQSGELTATTEFPVSEHAWRTGGAPSGTSTMFAAVRSNVPVSALIQGVVVQSANDGAIILAEGMAGSEAAFAERMNERAAELGLSQSRFVNPTGLPADGQAVSARDLARLERHIETTYPDLYPIYAQPEFEWNKILQRNRNPLLRLDLGATGMALGFAEGYGYSIAGATDKVGRKTFIALGGVESEAKRTSEAQSLLSWAAASFERQVLFSAGDSVGNAAIFGGTRTAVPLLLEEDLVAFVPREAADRVKAHVVYDGPLRAPVAKGDKIGRIEVRIGDKLSVSRDLVAAEDVGQGTFSSRAVGAAQELAFGWIRAL